MKRIVWAALFLLALGAGTVQAQEAPAGHRVSWAANVWAGLVEVVTSIFAPDQEQNAPAGMRCGGDTGAYIDPTGGCGA